MIVDVDTGFSPIELAPDIVMGWLAHPNTWADAADVTAFLKSMHGTVVELTGATVVADQVQTEDEPEFVCAGSVRKSLASNDRVISMIDGKPYRSLGRDISARGLTPQDYRERYGLKPDYPMVAESYSEARRAMAKRINLGRKPSQTTADKAGSGSVAKKVKV